MIDEENALFSDRLFSEEEKTQVFGLRKAELAGEPWLRLWAELNRCETAREEARARKRAKDTMESHLQMTANLAKHSAAKSQNGLADDF
jgi:hypothetical protein